MRRNFRLILAATIVATTALAACSSGDDDEQIVAASDAVIAANASSVLATQGAPFEFAGGVPAFGTTSTTTVAFSGTGTSPNFKIQASGATAEGVTQFGSCIFNVVSSSFPPPNPLQPGATITIADCAIVIDTDGQAANGVALTTEMQLRLNGLLSAEIGASVAVSPSGQIILNGQTVGTVQLVETTGGGG